MTPKYRKICPVCGEEFLTAYKQKFICCAECSQEYDAIKKFIFKRIKDKIFYVIREARETNKTEIEIIKDFRKNV